MARAHSLAARSLAIGFVGLDVLLLLAMRETLAVCLALVGLAGVAYLWARPARALAVVALGLPLFEPISSAIHDERPVFLAAILLLSLPAAACVWRAAWDAVADPASTALTSVRRLLGSPAFWLVTALGLLLLLGNLNTPSPIYGRGKTINYWFRNWLYFTAAVLILRGTEGRTMTFLRWALGAQVVFAGTGVWNFFTHHYPWRTRLVTMGENPIWVARHADMGLIILGALVASGRLSKGWAWTVGPLLAWVSWQAGSRGPMLALAAALGFWLWTNPYAQARGRRVRVLLLAGTALVGLGLFVYLSEARLQATPVSGREVSNFVRLRLLSVAQEALSRLPWHGLGTGGFSELVRVGDARIYPHNLFVEILLELGLPGLLAVTLFVLVCWRLWRRRCSPGPSATPPAGDAGGVWPAATFFPHLAATLFVYTLVAAQSSGDVPANEWVWLWAGMLVAWSHP